MRRLAIRACPLQAYVHAPSGDSCFTASTTRMSMLVSSQPYSFGVSRGLNHLIASCFNRVRYRVSRQSAPWQFRLITNCVVTQLVPKVASRCVRKRHMAILAILFRVRRLAIRACPQPSYVHAPSGDSCFAASTTRMSMLVSSQHYSFGVCRGLNHLIASCSNRVRI